MPTPRLPELTCPLFRSRTDAFFGNNHEFNETIFAETRRYWTGPVLDVNMLANSKIARQVESKSFNPTYRFTADTENFSLGEVAAPIVAFGDLEAGTVDQALVVYFFGTCPPYSYGAVVSADAFPQRTRGSRPSWAGRPGARSSRLRPSSASPT